MRIAGDGALFLSSSAINDSEIWLLWFSCCYVRSCPLVTQAGYSTIYWLSSNTISQALVSEMGFCHPPAHSCTLPLTPAHSRSLPLTPAYSRSLPLTPAHSRSLLHVLMYEYWPENAKSREMEQKQHHCILDQIYLFENYSCWCVFPVIFLLGRQAVFRFT